MGDCTSPSTVSVRIWVFALFVDCTSPGDCTSRKGRRLYQSVSLSVKAHMAGSSTSKAVGGSFADFWTKTLYPVVGKKDYERLLHRVPARRQKKEKATDEAFTSEALKFACEVGWISRGGGDIS